MEEIARIRMGVNHKRQVISVHTHTATLRTMGIARKNICYLPQNMNYVMLIIKFMNSLNHKMLHEMVCKTIYLHKCQ